MLRDKKLKNYKRNVALIQFKIHFSELSKYFINFCLPHR